MKTNFILVWLTFLTVPLLLSGCSGHSPTGAWKANDGRVTEFRNDGTFTVSNIPSYETLFHTNQLIGHYKTLDSSHLQITTSQGIQLICQFTNHEDSLILAEQDAPAQILKRVKN